MCSGLRLRVLAPRLASCVAGSGNLASLSVLRASVHQVPDLRDMHSGWEPLQRRHFAVISAWLHAGLLGRCSFSSPPLLAMSAPPSSAGC